MEDSEMCTVIKAVVVAMLCMLNVCALPVDRLHLPPLMGVSLAEFQNSGAMTVNKSNWAHWEASSTYENGHIHANQKSGRSCDFWNRYKQDVQLIKDIGLNACRLSLDWSMIEPTQGIFNKEALKHYHDVLDNMLENNITPMVTLHHFTHPQWFEALGAFEKTENLEFFKNFCIRVFTEFNTKVSLWCTINEPAPYVFQGYINKAFPPGVCDFTRAGTVLRNMLLAHVQVYQTLKRLPGGEKASIGCVHQYLTFEPYTSWNLIESVPAMMMNYIFNDIILNFFKTGNYLFYFPVLVEVTLNATTSQQLGIDLNKKPYFDFFGLNFYSRVVVQQKKWNPFAQDAVVPSCKDEEIMTDMPYPLYAEGLYKAIADVAQFKVPIYITENGIADSKDDRRESFFKEYLGVLSQALHDGYDVRGWFYWTLMDNFEWNDGFTPQFGLYTVDFATQERMLRPSVSWLKHVIKNNEKEGYSVKNSPLEESSQVTIYQV